MKVIKNIEISQIADYIANSNFDIVEINYLSNIIIYKGLVEQILRQYTLQVKDGYVGYKGIGLQYFDENNKLYDVVNQVSDLDESGGVIYTQSAIKNYTIKNEIGVLFDEFYNVFKSEEIELRRGRILVAEPGFQMKPHTDGISTGTLHYAVKTNPHSNIIIEGRRYHIPSNGRFYLINTSKCHWVENSSEEDRVHITFPLNPLCFNSITKHQWVKMREYFAQLNLDPKIIKDKIKN